MSQAVRLGRPPATDSADTRARILDAARAKFAAHGYDSASNRALAEAAGLTTGAIYHYFDSKLDIYVAVFSDAHELVKTRFEKAVIGLETFSARLQATLEAAHELNAEDPTLARFLGSSGVDAARNAELAKALRGAGSFSTAGFFRELVSFGIETGEINNKDRAVVDALLKTITIGLTVAVSGDLAQHRHAIDGINRLLLGGLIQPSG